MLSPSELEHSAVKECVDALVDSRGGLLLYGHGLAGREALVAAGAQLATTVGLPLTLVDAEALRDHTAAFLEQLGTPHHTFLSPAEAAHWPTGYTPNAVLAVHADALLDPAVEEPLLAAAREANRSGHLLVARRPNGASLLDAHTAQTHHLIASPMTTQTEAATGTRARYEPGPANDRAARRDYSPESPLLRDLQSPWRTQAAVAALRPPPPNPFYEQAADWEEWAQTFMDAATLRPNQTGEETIQGLQRFFTDLQTRQAAETAPSRPEQPGVTSAPSAPLADTSRTPAGSPPSAERHEGPQQRPSPTVLAFEHGPTHELGQQTSEETPDTSSAETDVISFEELQAVLEDPDFFRRAQQQAERMQADSLARLEEAAAALKRLWQDSRPDGSAEQHAPSSQRREHDPVRRHATSQDQTTTHQSPRQHPGR
ncbi:hypothetical protein [Streptomyces botrytidirepellens]|uniref:Uncharacterized protein n=1 Tax=Streptomyces botrytidirepellens TaxID=2486417 RepID=A0A3M8X6H1_9ACTN|nr:hypothetical protein [Streptomyces botrytidirepellens]RNG37992.1 hypothetical protein EEJ42_02070 [Streptomyces botrytidirepellens]